VYGVDIGVAPGCYERVEESECEAVVARDDSVEVALFVANVVCADVITGIDDQWGC